MRCSHWPTLFISSLALLTCPLQGQTPAQPSDPASSLTQPQALALQPITADWRATARNVWTVPYGLGVRKLVNVGQALKAYTLDSAYVLDLEKQVGSLEVGKGADIVVLEKDLYKIPTADISTTKVKLTMMNGNVTYSAQ
jgi:Amidohydrolase family